MAVVLTCVTLAAAGCRSGKVEPLPAPAAAVSMGYFNGTSLSGPTATLVRLDRPEDAASVRVRFIALEAMPGGVLEPVGAHARLIVVTRGGQPVLSAPQLTRGARFAAGESAAGFRDKLWAGALGRTAEIKSFVAALPVGATAFFEAADTQVPTSGAQPPPTRRLAVQLHRAQEGEASILRPAVLIEDFIELPDSSPPKVFQREMVLIDDLPLGEHVDGALLLPLRFTGAAGQAVAVIIEASPGSDDPAHAEAVDRCLAELRLSADEAGKLPDVAPIVVADWPGFESVLQSLQAPASRRAGLVFLASLTGARMCEDVALVGDDAVLKNLTERIARKIAGPNVERTRTSLGWLLDAAAFELLALEQAGGKIAPELSAILTMHCGQAGRDASSLEEIGRSMSTRQEMENRVIAENLIYLEDSSPASRVRAFDWLKARNLAPAGYDPLASNKQRREALDKAPAGQAAPTTRPIAP